MLPIIIFSFPYVLKGACYSKTFKNHSHKGAMYTSHLQDRPKQAQELKETWIPQHARTLGL